MPDGTHSAGGDDGFRIILPSRLLAVRRALRETRMRLEDKGVGAHAGGTVELVLAEVLNNIVRHAYGETDGVIEVEVTRQDTGTHCRIADRGVPMPDEAFPEAKELDPENARTELPEGGFGTLLVRQLADQIHYSRTGKRNVLAFVVPDEPATDA